MVVVAAVAGAGGVADTLTKCQRCTRTKCCTYVTQQIDAPRSIADFDFILWQVSHAGVRVFRDDDGWFLQFDTHEQLDAYCRKRFKRWDQRASIR